MNAAVRTLPHRDGGVAVRNRGAAQQGGRTGPFPGQYPLSAPALFGSAGLDKTGRLTRRQTLTGEPGDRQVLDALEKMLKADARRKGKAVSPMMSAESRGKAGNGRRRDSRERPAQPTIYSQLRHQGLGVRPFRTRLHHLAFIKTVGAGWRIRAAAWTSESYARV